MSVLILALPISVVGCKCYQRVKTAGDVIRSKTGARDYVAERASVKEVLKRQVSVSYWALASRSHHADSRTSDDSDDGIRGTLSTLCKLQLKKHARN